MKLFLNLIIFLVILFSINELYAHDLKFIRTIENVEEYELKNGLKLLLKQDFEKSTQTVAVSYMVGSKHEGYGEAGMAHIFEHLMFSSTKSIPSVSEALSQKGSEFNGITTFDSTGYFSKLSSSEESLEFLLRLEADRMRNLILSKENLAKELVVVRNEFEGIGNDPQMTLNDQMLSSAYLWHGYGRSVIGNKSDIENVPLEGLKAFYDRYYRPSNANLIIEGNFDKEKTLSLVEKIFGKIENPRDVVPKAYTREPAQEGRRSIVINREAGESILSLMYHIPAISSKDHVAINALSGILSAKIRGLLHKELISRTGLAISVDSAVYNLKEPSVLIFNIRFEKNKKESEILRAATSIIENVKENAIKEKDLIIYKNQFKRAYLFGEAFGSQEVIDLMEWSGLGDWSLVYSYREAMDKLTIQDLLYARKYLKESNRTEGYLIATSVSQKIDIQLPSPQENISKLFPQRQSLSPLAEESKQESKKISDHIESFKVSEGISAGIYHKSPKNQKVLFDISLSVENDSIPTNQRLGLSLWPELLGRGNDKLSAEEFEDEKSIISAEITHHFSWFSGFSGVIRIRGSSLKESFPKTLDLILKSIVSPRLIEKDISSAKAVHKSRMSQLKMDPLKVGSRNLLRAAYSYEKSNPRYIPSLEEEDEAVEKITLKDLIVIKNSLLKYGRLNIAVTGNVSKEDLIEQLDRLPKEYFSMQKSELKTYERGKAVPRDGVIKISGLQGSVISSGAVFPISDSDPDFPALRFGLYIWGEGLGSRLAKKLRFELGLSYTAESSLILNPTSKNVLFLNEITTAPENLEKAFATFKSEFADYIRAGISTEEFEAAKKTYFATREVNFSHDSFVNPTLLKNLESNRDFKFEEDLDEKIKALSLGEMKKALQRWVKLEDLTSYKLLPK